MDIESAKRYSTRRRELEQDIRAYSPTPEAAVEGLTSEERFQRLGGIVRQTAARSYVDDNHGANYERTAIVPEVGGLIVTARYLKHEEPAAQDKLIQVHALWSLPDESKNFAFERVFYASVEHAASSETLRQLALLEQSLSVTNPE